MLFMSPLGGPLGFLAGGAPRYSAPASPISLSTQSATPVGFTVLANGIVEFAAWGAGGAAYCGATGGAGGFAGGKVFVYPGNIVRFGAGQGGFWGLNTTNPPGGVGAGGMANGGAGGGTGWGGSGGGASILWIDNQIIAVAGGGAGARNNAGPNGGPGGGPSFGGAPTMNGTAGGTGSEGGGGGGGGWTGGSGAPAASQSRATGGSGYLANIVCMDRLLLDGGVDALYLPVMRTHLRYFGTCGQGTHSTSWDDVSGSPGLVWCGYTPL